MASGAGLLSADVHAALEAVWKGVVESFVDVDPSRRALRQVRGWASSNQPAFWGREDRNQSSEGDGGPRTPVRGWAGAWPPFQSWEYICFIPEKLKEVLDQLGHEPEGIIGDWERRGWLIVDVGRRTKKTVIHRDRKRCIVIRRTALIEIGEDYAPDPAPRFDAMDTPDNADVL